MNMIKLYGKPIRCNKATTERGQELDVGANLFIGNLDPEVDEKILHDTFSAFGSIQQPKVILVGVVAMSLLAGLSKLRAQCDQMTIILTPDFSRSKHWIQQRMWFYFLRIIRQCGCCYRGHECKSRLQQGQFLMNRAITVSYALKKDGKGERHGSAAERLLAAQGRFCWTASFLLKFFTLLLQILQRSF
jgi:splicing factor 3B subunit 4